MKKNISRHSRMPLSGIQISLKNLIKTWTPAFAGVTTTFRISAFAGMTLGLTMVTMPSYSATTYIPVINGNFMTGQWFFDGKQSAMGGNAGLAVIPAVRFDSEFSLIPSFESSYRGTRSAEELAGGNTLFQDTWENGLNVKAIHGLSPTWKLKERIGAHMKWYRETTNETWSKGLYDWRSFSGGLEIENRLTRDMNWSIGYDLSSLKFPNYESLEAAQSNTMAREYAGAHPLDNIIHLASLQFKSPLFWSMDTRVRAFYSPRFYTDQTIVLESGLLSSQKRKDTYSGETLELNRLFATPGNSKLLASLNYGYSEMNSNQNHFDAKQDTYINNFYAYTANQIGGSLTLAFGNLSAGPMMIDTGYSFSKRSYSDRLTQDSSGAYLADKLYVNESVVTLGFSYPISKNFKLRTSSSIGRSSSNNHFEELYRYNYTNTNYLFGFTYDY